MIRAILDPGVLVSALLSRSGAPARLLSLWSRGHYDLVVSPHLLTELAIVLRREKFRRYLSEEEAEAFVHWLKGAALLVPDPAQRPRYTRDPNDDYLIAAAKAAGVPLVVSGDRDLLAFSDPPPVVLTPAAFLDALKGGPG